jgi:LysR family glycine cleavage system transcriptional activator
MRDQPNPWAPAGVKVRRSRIRHLELAARSRVWRPPHLSVLPAFGFREESHAIEAAIAGQGLAICSDVLVATELASGALIPVCRARLPGYGFYIVHRAGHPKFGAIKALIEWARSSVSA